MRQRKTQFIGVTPKLTKKNLAAMIQSLSQQTSGLVIPVTNQTNHTLDIVSAAGRFDEDGWDMTEERRRNPRNPEEILHHMILITRQMEAQLKIDPGWTAKILALELGTVKSLR